MIARKFTLQPYRVILALLICVLYSSFQPSAANAQSLCGYCNLEGWCQGQKDTNANTNDSGSTTSCFHLKVPTAAQMNGTQPLPPGIAYDAENDCYGCLCEKVTNYAETSGSNDDPPGGEDGSCGCDTCQQFQAVTGGSEVDYFTYQQKDDTDFACVQVSCLGYDPDDFPAEEEYVMDPFFSPSNPDEGRICKGATAAQSDGEGGLDFGFKDPINIRWFTEEPNILATLPIVYDSAGNGFKHYDLVFQSQTRDIGAPYMEPVIPFPSALFAGSGLSSESQTTLDDTLRFEAVNEMGTHLKTLNSLWRDSKISFKKPTNTNSEINAANSRGLDTDYLLNKPKVQEEHAYRYVSSLTAASQAFANPLASDMDNEARPYINPRAQEAIIGPRGCDIGGWYEMMLYQARCIKWHHLNCLCDYEKTFILGSAEAYVLKKAGATFNTVTPLVRDSAAFNSKRYMVTSPGATNAEQLLPEGKLSYFDGKLTFPLMWRGNAGPSYALWRSDNVRDFKAPIRWEGNQPPPDTAPHYYDQSIANYVFGRPSGSLDNAMYKKRRMFVKSPGERVGPRLWDPDNLQWDVGINGSYDPTNSAVPENFYYRHEQYKGLNHAEQGDFIIWDETVTNADGKDARYRRHIAFVESVRENPTDDRYVDMVKVSEYNYGKNLDSCGNTDRWKRSSIRKLHRNRERVDFDPEKDFELLRYFGPCDDPDNTECWEPNWNRVKIYRPSWDFSETVGSSGVTEQGIRPTCERFSCIDENDDPTKCNFYTPGDVVTVQCNSEGLPVKTFAGRPLIPMPITQRRTMLEAKVLSDARGSDLFAPAAEDIRKLAPVTLYDHGLWRLGKEGKFDANELKHFLQENIGRCDPPLYIRDILPAKRERYNKEWCCEGETNCSPN